MPRIVSVWLPDWPIERLARRAPGCIPRTQPFALVEAGAYGLELTAVNAAARAAGVTPRRVTRGLVTRGLSLADARAMWPGLLTAPAEIAADNAALISLARWLGRYGPAHNRDGPDGAWIDVTGVPHLFGGEPALLDDLVKRLAALGITARAGLADTLGAAHALARFATEAPAPAAMAPPGAAREALSSLPVAALRLSRDTVHLLERLGLKRIGALYGLPRAALERRFRDDPRRPRGASPAAGPRAAVAAVLWRLDQALGLIAEPRQPLAAPPQADVRLPCPEPLITAEGLAAALDRLARELGGRLEHQAFGARRFRLRLYRADGTIATVGAGTSAPCRDPAHLVGLLVARLARVDAGFGIDLVELAAAGLERLADTQTALTAGHLGPDSGAGPLIDRLASRLGAGAVIRLVAQASHIPERAEARVPVMAAPPGASSVQTPPQAPRPPLLLRPPEPVTVIAEVPDGAPFRIIWRRVPRRIVRAEGPERIAPEWWRALAVESGGAVGLAGGARAVGIQAERGSANTGQPKRHQKTRDYYRLEDVTGAGYWVFREGLYGREETSPHGQSCDGQSCDGQPRWFLQGVFG